MIQQNYCSRYLVVKNGDVYEKCKFDHSFLSFQPKHISIGKPNVCEITQFSEANDSSDFDGKTISLECQDNEYLHISECEVNKLRTDDKNIDYISCMGNNMLFSTMAVEKNTNFISDNCKFIENDKIDEGTLLNATNDNLDPFLYHLGKNSVDSLKTLERSHIHNFYIDCEENVEDEEDVLVEEYDDMIETN